MPDTPELQSLADAAAQAAAAQDYTSAEWHLSQLALLQGTSLGPLHPDLANTHNNLGVVCELGGKPLDAELHFRQAWTIASTALGPDHALVATSRKNLEEFCAAHGVAVDAPTPPRPEPAASAADPGDALRPEPLVPAPGKPAVPPGRPEPAAVPGLAERAERSHRSQRVVSARLSRAPAPTSRWWPLPAGAVAAGGVLLTLLAAILWFRAGDGSTTAPPPVEQTAGVIPDERATATAPSAGVEARTVDAAPATPVAPPLDPPPSTPEPAPSPPVAAGNRSTAASAALAVEVVTARICGTFSTAGSEWACEPPAAPAGPGRLTFYTRIRSSRNTTIEHRWYQGETVRQTVTLKIGANPGSGYRTYSRHTLGSADGGEWRVELRDSAGVVLHEERFLVRE